MAVSIKKCFQPRKLELSPSVALLILRLVVGAAFMIHGSLKIQSPTSWMPSFVPVPGFLQALAAISEFGGGLAWILGLLTPLACLGILCTMSVAIYMHMMILHQPFVDLKGAPSYEIASAYWVIALLLLIVGPGKLSADWKIFGPRS